MSDKLYERLANPGFVFGRLPRGLGDREFHRSVGKRASSETWLWVSFDEPIKQRENATVGVGRPVVQVCGDAAFSGVTTALKNCGGQAGFGAELGVQRRFGHSGFSHDPADSDRADPFCIEQSSGFGEEFLPACRVHANNLTYRSVKRLAFEGNLYGKASGRIKTMAKTRPLWKRPGL
ncbi:hypothetical protein cgR_0531 [Corynebacterium glutamicum R]|uniref:Uncharacterized protein n=1 Tax=Corynebacterium glutamicum (strain R) TaxID=340322 RepID=A0AB72V9Q0_CORGB|nr:hypothetical protein cgR_0531 [Corynebacterium glutamicum R]